MDSALEIILNVLRQAWIALTLFIVTAAALALLAKTLSTLGSSAIGARMMVWQSLATLAAVIILVVFAFVGIPAIIKAVSTSVPKSPGCANIVDTNPNFPLTELGVFAAGLIAAIAGVRMMLAVARTIGGAAIGGSAEVSQALVEVVEAMFGMLIASIVIPLVVVFFPGLCA